MCVVVCAAHPKPYQVATATSDNAQGCACDAWPLLMCVIIEGADGLELGALTTVLGAKVGAVVYTPGRWPGAVVGTTSTVVLLSSSSLPSLDPVTCSSKKNEAASRAFLELIRPLLCVFAP